MAKKIGFLLVCLILLVIGYNLIIQIRSALLSADRLSEGAEALYNLEAKNKELKKQLSEIKSPAFIEQQARDKLGLSKKGETVVIIPDEKINQVLGINQKIQEIKLPNWLGWLKVFWH